VWHAPEYVSCACADVFRMRRRRGREHVPRISWMVSAENVPRTSLSPVRVTLSCMRPFSPTKATTFGGLARKLMTEGARVEGRRPGSMLRRTRNVPVG
jgi:hypothetical protein